jgi:hypothetical protein
VGDSKDRPSSTTSGQSDEDPTIESFVREAAATSLLSMPGSFTSTRPRVKAFDTASPDRPQPLESRTAI